MSVHQPSCWETWLSGSEVGLGATPQPCWLGLDALTAAGPVAGPVVHRGQEQGPGALIASCLPILNMRRLAVLMAPRGWHPTAKGERGYWPLPSRLW